MRRAGDVAWGIVDAVLRLPPAPDDEEGKATLQAENNAEREAYVSLTTRVDDLRYERNELETRLNESDNDGDTLRRARDDLARQIEDLDRKRRGIFLNQSSPWTHE